MVLQEGFDFLGGCVGEGVFEVLQTFFYFLGADVAKVNRYRLLESFDFRLNCTGLAGDSIS